MISMPVLSRVCLAELDDYEPASEGLDGEAWVNPVPTFLGVCESARASDVKAAASDWIPV